MAGTEKRDISIRGATLLNVGIIGLLLVATVGMRLLFGYFRARESAAQPPPLSLVRTESRPLPPEPRLQMTPSLDSLAVRAADEAALGGYGWVDRKAGKVRIPIARAIDLVAERGLPARAPGAAWESKP